MGSMYDTVRSKPYQEEKAKENQPHPDVRDNAEYFHKMLKRVEFAPDIDTEISKLEWVKELKDGKWVMESRVKEYMNCAFIYGPIGARKGTYNISFHQTSRDFKQEMCNILNHMGNRGFLKRLDVVKTAEEVKRDGEWEKLFGTYR